MRWVTVLYTSLITTPSRIVILSYLQLNLKYSYREKYMPV